MLQESILNDDCYGARTTAVANGSERTRLLIVEAYLALLRKNLQMPTAAQIAGQAGARCARYSSALPISLHSQLRDLVDYAIAAGQAEAVARDVAGDRPTRIRSHVATRALACEKWLPLWRVLMATQDQLAELKARVVLALC